MFSKLKKFKKIWLGMRVLVVISVLVFINHYYSLAASPPTVVANNPPDPGDIATIAPGFWFNYNDPDSDQMVSYWVRMGTDPGNLQLFSDVTFFPSLPLDSGEQFFLEFQNLDYGTTYYFYVGVTDSSGASGTTPQAPAVGLYGFTTKSIDIPSKSQPPFDGTMLPYPNQQVSFQAPHCLVYPVDCPGLGTVEYKVYLGPEPGSLVPITCDPLSVIGGSAICYLSDSAPLTDGVYWWDVVAEARNGGSFGISHTPSMDTAWRVEVRTPAPSPISGEYWSFATKSGDCICEYGSFTGCESGLVCYEITKDCVEPCQRCFEDTEDICTPEEPVDIIIDFWQEIFPEF